MIKVALIGPHGIAREIMANPPKGVKYVSITPKKHFITKVITSPFSYKYYYDENVDLIESPIFPIITKQPWIYTPADAHTFMSFELFHCPVPRAIRSIIVKRIFEKKNFIKLIFKSEAGRKTLYEYPKLVCEKIMNKTIVVYPAVRKVKDTLIRFNKDKVNILFSGPFIRKGGIHVVEAFEELQREFKNIKLRICSREDFMTENQQLAQKYKEKIERNKDIIFGWVNREQLLNEILPDTDIFVCPTYRDSYGYAIEEAMAFGIPVIATDYFAIPEIVEHNRNGFLIKIRNEPFIQSLKGYMINHIPRSFHEYMTREVYKYLRLLISDYSLRKKMGLEGLKIAREKFSFEKRNSIMLNIYHEALQKRQEGK